MFCVQLPTDRLQEKEDDAESSNAGKTKVVPKGAKALVKSESGSREICFLLIAVKREDSSWDQIELTLSYHSV